jgi:site-specific DNA recombinase
VHGYGRNSTPTSIRACVYCRISLARFGDTLKVDDQERICRELAAARGWTIDDRHVYKDNSVSAWRKDRRRPGWDDMLAAVERREVDAIIVYHGDRLIRQPWDLELLLRLADERHIQLASASGSRDLSSEDDRFILRIEAAAACREVAATSRRLKRYYERRAEEGIVRLGGRGGRAFGFEPDGLTVRPADADMIRQVAERILHGEPVSAICRDLNARGYRTTTGGQWAHGTLSKLMQRARLAGLVSHHGRIVGPAAWPAILDRGTWEAVCAALSGKAQVLGFTPTNERRYLLSGLAVCGSCGHTVAARHNTRGRQLIGYGCINPACDRKVHRHMEKVDRFVTGAVVALLADPKIRQRLAPRGDEGLGQELERLEARRRRLVAAQANLLATSDDDVDMVAFRAAVEQVDGQVAAVRDRLGESVASRALDGLFGIGLGEFVGLPLPRRRAAVRVLVRVTILPSGRRGPVFDPSSIRLEPMFSDGA